MRVEKMVQLSRDGLRSLRCGTRLLLWTAVCTGVPAIAAQMAAPPAAVVSSTGLLSSADAERLLPASVFFHGQSAPLQLRNTAAYRTSAGRMIWAGLVDTSGYSSGVREKYQFYLVTEVPLGLGKLTVQPGAYGGGFLANGSLVLMNVAGDEVGHTPVQEDRELRRPRPLQMIRGDTELRLYLGRQFVNLDPQQSR